MDAFDRDGEGSFIANPSIPLHEVLEAPSSLSCMGNCRSDNECGLVAPLTPERHCHLVRAGLGSSVTHLIHESSPAGVAGGIGISARVRYCRDHISITVDVNVGRGR